MAIDLRVKKYQCMFAVLKIKDMNTQEIFHLAEQRLKELSHKGRETKATLLSELSFEDECEARFWIDVKNAWHNMVSRKMDKEWQTLREQGAFNHIKP